jgi:very-short-patch-repair endonuclease
MTRGLPEEPSRERWDGLRQRAREMRQNPPPAEEAMWSLLRDRRLSGFKFRRQHHLRGYLVDLSCFARRLVIELDGPIHDMQREADAERQVVIESFGYRVLRFTNEEVLNHPARVVEKLISELSRRS